MYGLMKISTSSDFTLRRRNAAHDVIVFAYLIVDINGQPVDVPSGHSVLGLRRKSIDIALIFAHFVTLSTQASARFLHHRARFLARTVPALLGKQTRKCHRWMLWLYCYPSAGPKRYAIPSSPMARARCSVTANAPTEPKPMDRPSY